MHPHPYTLNNSHGTRTLWFGTSNLHHPGRSTFAPQSPTLGHEETLRMEIVYIIRWLNSLDIWWYDMICMDPSRIKPMFAHSCRERHITNLMTEGHVNPSGPSCKPSPVLALHAWICHKRSPMASSARRWSSKHARRYAPCACAPWPTTHHNLFPTFKGTRTTTSRTHRTFENGRDFRNVKYLGINVLQLHFQLYKSLSHIHDTRQSKMCWIPMIPMCQLELLPGLHSFHPRVQVQGCNNLIGGDGAHQVLLVGEDHHRNLDQLLLTTWTVLQLGG